ncbi:ureidoglycolate hydrolase [Verticiella sediminum]|uniref:Ureidoglycolate hydrolase n=1 Tax=Verticiella sediminum TaxID=1247510 RepID=A0A556AU35_9BURK|nr:ureidoglycolate lyase [Verticiella sediminum]TSH96449.1 ureidoglycolate hydrolase [Verticiella sediminum]
MHASNQVICQPLTEHAFAPYGWMLGKPLPAPAAAAVAFSNAATDFWQQHVFDAGAGGETEILWVNYRSTEPMIGTLEVHDLTEQALVPLTGPVLHVVARSRDDGSPDLASLRAFALHPGQGVCMRPGCWHASRVPEREAACLMLTRRSTTADLVRHLRGEADGTESRLATLATPFLLAT